MSESTNKKAIKAGIGYTIGNILVRGISFISLPIFARLLTVDDYGIVNIFSSYEALLSVCIGFALHASVRNAKIEYKNEVDRYSSSITLPTLLNTLLLAVISVLFARWLATALKLPDRYLVLVLVLASAATAIVNLYNAVLSVDYRYKEYTAISVVYAVLAIGLSITLVIWLFPDNRYAGRIIGTAVSEMLLCAYALFRLYSKARPELNAGYIRYGMRIGLPIVPHGLSQVVLVSFDRIMINAMIGEYAAGIYSFGNNMAVIFQVIVLSLDTAWTQWFFDKMEENSEEEIRKTSNYYAAIMALLAIGLMLITPEFVILMGDEKYRESCALAIPLVLAMFFSFMYTFPVAAEYYHKKNEYIAIGTMIAALLNIVLNAIFIPKFGFIAAAYTTIACYLVYYVLHLVISAKVHGHMIYNLKIHLLITLAVVAVTVLCLVCIDLPAVRYSIAAVIAASLIYLALKNRELLKRLWTSFRKKDTV